MYNDVNQGRCGECGDEWRLARPRPNEEGGLYGTGLIGQNYVQGAVLFKAYYCLINKGINKIIIFKK